MRITGMMQNPAMSRMATGGGNKLAAIVSQLNNKIQLKRNYDVTAFDSKLTALNKTHEQEKSAGDYKLEYENSPMNGVRSVAEWAELATNGYRNSLDSLSQELEYQKALLTKRAEDGSGNITTDYTDTVNKFMELNTWSADLANSYSGGLASPIIGDTIEGITAEGLGLTNLSGNPDEIMAALTAAQEKLSAAARTIEESFAAASDKQLAPNDTPTVDRTSWDNRMAFDNAKVVDLTGGVATNGKTLKMN